MISSASNPQIKNIVELQKKARERKKQRLFVVEGIKMVEEAKKNGLQKAYIEEAYCEQLQNERPEFFEDLNYEVVSDKVYKHMTETVTPQGILAVVTMPIYSLDDVLNQENGCYMVLENLRDPGNMGTIIRASEGAGVAGVIMSRESVDVFNPKVIRSTMGSIYRVPFIYVDDFAGTLNLMKSKSITLYAAHLKGRNNYDQEDYKKACGILIGNEANGLTEEASMQADVLVKIPMCGQVESLNAAIASALFMYEAARQRRN
ncbi:rRNA methylase [Lachnospiraceae bacterium KM106-2]|nr:rRNA methylase [Lachnospiraceae bacterium KM106-2]